MLLSPVSVLVVAQSSSEIPEGLMNNPVYGLRTSRLANRTQKLSCKKPKHECINPSSSINRKTGTDTPPSLSLPSANHQTTALKRKGINRNVLEPALPHNNVSRRPGIFQKLHFLVATAFSRSSCRTHSLNVFITVRVNC